MSYRVKLESRSAPPQECQMLTKSRWIEMYGGQEKLDAENFDVVECDKRNCDDSLCHGWRVVPRNA